jgi:hypothetical protein
MDALAGCAWKPAAQVVVHCLLVVRRDVQVRLFQGTALATAGGASVQRVTGCAEGVQAAPADAMGPPVELVPVGGGKREQQQQQQQKEEKVSLASSIIVCAEVRQMNKQAGAQEW